MLVILTPKIFHSIKNFIHRFWLVFSSLRFNMTVIQMVEMNVHMDCPGCESDIKKALQKIDGVDDIDIDMAMQKVTVTGWVDRGKVLRAVRRTGRLAEFWPFPYNPEYDGFTNYYYDQPRYDYRNDPSTYYNQHRYEYRNDPSTYYNQHRYEYRGDPSTYYNQPRYEYQNDPSTYYNQDRHDYRTNPYDNYMSQPAAVPSYNYYVHGYTGLDHGYFNEPPHSTILDDKARSMFSDDNANACSIM